MKSKADQLLLELCLLRLRYSADEIERVAHSRYLVEDSDLRKLMVALKELQVGASEAKRYGGLSKKPKRLSFGVSRNQPDVRITIAFFVERIAQRKILRTNEELDNFARSLGIAEAFGDRQEAGNGIRKSLESLPPLQALQRMRSIDRHLKSDSDPYVDLAKTIMKS